MLSLEVQRLNELLGTRNEPAPVKMQTPAPRRTNLPMSRGPTPIMTPIVSISKLPKDYTPNYSFQHSDEMKIMMVRPPFEGSILNDWLIVSDLLPLVNEIDLLFVCACMR